MQAAQPWGDLVDGAAPWRLPGTPVAVRCTGAGDGDLRCLAGEASRSAQLAEDVPTEPPAGLPALPVVVPHQVHGATVLVAGDVAARLTDAAPAPLPSGTWRRLTEGEQLVDGDAVVAAGRGVAVAVLTADCAPLALGTADGVFAAVHVGWRGLMAGVIEAAVAAVAAASDASVVGVIGPAIGPCCYEFHAPELQAVLARTGGIGRGVTTGGRPALDLPAAVRAVAVAQGVLLGPGRAPCTACGGAWFSHRARRQPQRQATVVWQAA